MLTSAQIAAALAGPGILADKCRSLIDQANAAGGEDNITVVLAESTADVPVNETPPVVADKEPTLIIPVQTTERWRQKLASLAVPAALALIAGNILLGCFLFIRFRHSPASPVTTVVANNDTAEKYIYDQLYPSQLHKPDSVSLDIHIEGTDTTIYIDKPVVIYWDRIHWYQPKTICFEPRDSSCRIGLIITGKQCGFTNVIFQRFRTDILNCNGQ
jgi:hypothetical protein